MESTNHLYEVDIQIPFFTVAEAEIAYNSLRIDAEPKRGGTKRQLSVDSNVLKVKLQSDCVRTLRTAVTSFMDLAVLVTKTISEFGPPLIAQS